MAAKEDWTIPVFERAKDSVCYVVISPRERKLCVIERFAKAAGNVDNDEQSVRCRESKYSTGFIVGSKDNLLFILTTAHAIDHVYKASLSLSGQQVNSLFQASILCDHYESDYRDAGLAQLDDDKRSYVPGTIFAVSCELNLLLITVERENIKRRSTNEMCAGIHQGIQISASLPRVGAESMLLSWPPHKHRAVATGCVGERRNVGEVTKPNIMRYDMEVLEANITTESSSAGAPLLSKSGEVIGVVHGGFEQTHSYFIPSDLIIKFLASLGTTSDQGEEVGQETKGKGKEPMGKGEGKWSMEKGQGSGKQRKR